MPKSMHKDKVRKIVLGLTPQDGVNLLFFLGAREDKDQNKLFDRGAPLLIRNTSLPERVKEIVQSGVVPTAYVVVYLLYGQKFNVLIEGGENSIIAAIALDVDCPWGLHKTVLCIPDEYVLRTGDSAWQLYQNERYKISFHSDAVAKAMVALGVGVA